MRRHDPIIPATVVGKSALDGRNLFSARQSDAVARATTWDALVVALAGGSPQAALRAAAATDGRVVAAEVFQLINACLRGVNVGIGITVDLLPDRVGDATRVRRIKVGLDWTMFVFGKLGVFLMENKPPTNRQILDIAMTDAMFTFGWYAYASGVTIGRFPGSGEGPLVGGSPRYRLYPTNDSKLVACGAIEEHFWRAFTKAVGLDDRHADDKSDPAATIAAVSERIADRSAEEWKPIFAAADCCATIVATLEEALRDPHFIQRGLFAHKIANSSGATIPALPVPIAPQFRADAETPKSAPALGAQSKAR